MGWPGAGWGSACRSPTRSPRGAIRQKGRDRQRSWEIRDLGPHFGAGALGSRLCEAALLVKLVETAPGGPPAHCSDARDVGGGTDFFLCPVRFPLDAQENIRKTARQNSYSKLRPPQMPIRAIFI